MDLNSDEHRRIQELGQDAYQRRLERERRERQELAEQWERERKQQANENARAEKATVNENTKKAKADRWQRLNHFCDVTGRQCTPTEQAVWMRLFRHERNGQAVVSLNQLAAEAGMSVRHTSRAIAALKRGGFVRLKRRGNSGGYANTYIVISNPPMPDPPHPDDAITPNPTEN